MTLVLCGTTRVLTSDGCAPCVVPQVPLLTHTCGCLLRENVKDATPGATDESACYFALKRLAVLSHALLDATPSSRNGEKNRLCALDRHCAGTAQW